MQLTKSKFNVFEGKLFKYSSQEWNKKWGKFTLSRQLYDNVPESNIIMIPFLNFAK